MTSKYDKICVDILSKNGPLLGNEFIRKIAKRVNVKNDNARKIVQRQSEKANFKDTGKVKFKNNQKIYYLPYHDLTAKLKKIMPDQSKIRYRIVQAIIEEKGFLLWTEFSKICSGVINNSASKKKTVYEIFNDLYLLEIVQKGISNNGISYVYATEKWYPSKKSLANKVEDRIHKLSLARKLTEDLIRWLEKMNISAWKGAEISSFINIDQDFNGFYFDAYSMTYLYGYYQNFGSLNNKKGSPVLIESILHRNAKKHDITGFISRFENVVGPTKKKKPMKILPICFVDTLEKDAFSLAKEKGILVIKLSDVFGVKLSQAITELQSISIENVSGNITKFAGILDKIEDTTRDGGFGNLRGIVFNFIIASIFQNSGKPVLIEKEFGKKGSKQCEIDIFYEDPDKVIICEVKGYLNGKEVQLGKNSNDKDSIKRFFERSYNIVKDDIMPEKQIVPVFITTGSFSEEAEVYLEKENNSKKTNRLLKESNFPSSVYYDREKLLEYLKLDTHKNTYKSHREVIKKYF